eukprot:570947-Prymnesium_polylepis.1
MVTVQDTHVEHVEWRLPTSPAHVHEPTVAVMKEASRVASLPLVSIYATSLLHRLTTTRQRETCARHARDSCLTLG